MTHPRWHESGVFYIFIFYGHCLQSREATLLIYLCNRFYTTLWGHFDFYFINWTQGYRAHNIVFLVNLHSFLWQGRQFSSFVYCVYFCMEWEKELAILLVYKLDFILEFSGRSSYEAGSLFYFRHGLNRTREATQI